MIRIVLGAAALAAYLPTQSFLGSSHLQQLPWEQFSPFVLAQGAPPTPETVKPGIVVFEDKFADESGGWSFGGNSGLDLAAPGAELQFDNRHSSRIIINEKKHIGWWGDFSAEVSFPPNVAPDTAFGVAFWAINDESFWVVRVYASGRVDLSKFTKGHSTTAWETMTSNLVKTGQTDVNTVQAKVKPGMVAIIVNGQTLGSVNAEALGFKFGIYGECHTSPESPVSIIIHSYKVATYA